jgi:hypothetical protein
VSERSFFERSLTTWRWAKFQGRWIGVVRHLPKAAAAAIYAPISED